MTADPVRAAKPVPRQGKALSLWNLQEALGRLADELAAAARRFDAMAGDTVSTVSTIEQMETRRYFESLIAMHRTRERYLGSEFFGEQAWDLLLELMIARIAGSDRRASELSIHETAGNAATKEIIDSLSASKLVDCFDNAEDQNDPYLTLSSEVARRMAELYRARMRG